MSMNGINFYNFSNNSRTQQLPNLDPESYAQQYATQNNISIEKARSILKAEFGDPTQKTQAPNNNNQAGLFGGSNSEDSYIEFSPLFDDSSDISAFGGYQQAPLFGGNNNNNQFSSFGMQQQAPQGQQNPFGGNNNQVQRPQGNQQQAPQGAQKSLFGGQQQAPQLTRNQAPQGPQGGMQQQAPQGAQGNQQAPQGPQGQQNPFGGNNNQVQRPQGNQQQAPQGGMQQQPQRALFDVNNQQQAPRLAQNQASQGLTSGQKIQEMQSELVKVYPSTIDNNNKEPETKKRTTITNKEYAVNTAKTPERKEYNSVSIKKQQNQGDKQGTKVPNNKLEIINYAPKSILERAKTPVVNQQNSISKKETNIKNNKRQIPAGQQAARVPSDKLQIPAGQITEKTVSLNGRLAYTDI